MWSIQTLGNIVRKKQEVGLTLTSPVKLLSHVNLMVTEAFSFVKKYTTAFSAGELLLMKPTVSLRT